MKANEFFTQEWGTGFTKATLSEKNGLLEMSMEDIYSTMERYAELRLSNVEGQSEQLVCECGNKLTDKEVYFGQCLQCDKNVEE
jgi:hypothetical protein